MFVVFCWETVDFRTTPEASAAPLIGGNTAAEIAKCLSFLPKVRAKQAIPAKVEELLKRAEREVAEGLLPVSDSDCSQRQGRRMNRLGIEHGGADKPVWDETLYCVFSCTRRSSSAMCISDRQGS